MNHMRLIDQEADHGRVTAISDLWRTFAFLGACPVAGRDPAQSKLPRRQTTRNRLLRIIIRTILAIGGTYEHVAHSLAWNFQRDSVRDRG